jgi:hypothetical protein
MVFFVRRKQFSYYKCENIGRYSMQAQHTMALTTIQIRVRRMPYRIWTPASRPKPTGMARGGDWQHVGAGAGGRDGQHIRHGIQVQGTAQRNHDGDADGCRTGIAGHLRHEAGERAEQEHGEQPAGQLEGAHELRHLVDGTRLDNHGSQGQARRRHDHDAPHGILFRKFPRQDFVVVFVPQDEQEHTEDEEDVRRLQSRQVRRVKRPDERQDDGQQENPEAPFFARAHGTEFVVHLAELFPRAVEGLHRHFQVPQEEQVQQEQDEKQRNKAADPLDVHEFVARQLLHVLDGHQIGRAPDGRPEAADAAPPGNGQENGDGQFTFRNIFLSDEAQHPHGNGAENRCHDGVRQKGRQNDGRTEPDEDLTLQGRADKAQGAQGNAPVQPRGGPAQADQVGPQQQDDDVREIAGDDMGIGDQRKGCIDGDWQQGCHGNMNGPENPPDGHPDRRTDGKPALASQHRPQNQGGQQESQRSQQYFGQFVCHGAPPEFSIGNIICSLWGNRNVFPHRGH